MWEIEDLTLRFDKLYNFTRRHCASEIKMGEGKGSLPQIGVHKTCENE